MTDSDRGLQHRRTGFLRAAGLLACGIALAACGEGPSGARIDLRCAGLSPEAGPVALAGDARVKQLVANLTIWFVLTDDGAVHALAGARSAPEPFAPPAGLPAIATIACSLSHVVALDAAGRVWCWGSNASGECISPPELGRVVDVAATEGLSAAVGEDGSVRLWGDAATQERMRPPAGTPPLRRIAMGRGFAPGLTRGGTVVAWGANDFGQATPPAGLTGVVQIACGGAHGVALRSDGTVACWGRNRRRESTPPEAMPAVVQIACGLEHTVALCADGTVRVWGACDSAQCDVRAKGPVECVGCGPATTIVAEQVASGTP